jgi:hypothetical protein
MHGIFAMRNWFRASPVNQAALVALFAHLGLLVAPLV